MLDIFHMHGIDHSLSNKVLLPRLAISGELLFIEGHELSLLHSILPQSNKVLAPDAIRMVIVRDFLTTMLFNNSSPDLPPGVKMMKGECCGGQAE